MATSALGRALRSARKAAGWSRETLATKSDTSVPAIARTELYGAEPKLSTLYKWARALGVEPTDLLDSLEITDLSAEVNAALAVVRTPDEAAS